MKQLLMFAVLAAGCADDPQATTHPVGGCDGVENTVADLGGMHAPQNTDLTWSSNPPATGTHYPTWAGWDRSYPSLPRGNYLHNAEHGGVILLYNCPAGCPDVVDALTEVIKTMAIDPTCAPPIRNRALLVADPLLPDGVQVAAVAWDVYYTASCFDPYVATFAKNHYRHAPEDFCNEGNGAGGTFIDPRIGP